MCFCYCVLDHILKMAEKKSSQIDVTTMMCRVCGDKAFGLHYGVHSCERCIRFFKRSIKHSAQYKPCKKKQQCSIVWYNLKKCNSCHLNKCIAVGMSKCKKSKIPTKKPNIYATKKKVKVPDNEMQEILSAMQKIRISKRGKYKITAAMNKFNIMKHKKLKLSTSVKKVYIPDNKKVSILDGMQKVNVPKHNKTKILVSVQNTKTNSPDEDLAAQQEDDFKLTASIKKAHEDTCDIIKEKVAERSLPDKLPTQPRNGFSLVCPLNTVPYPINKSAPYCEKEHFELFTTAIQGVIEFAKRISCFKSLSKWDQDVLLKAGVFEVLLVRLAYLFNSQDGLLLIRDLDEADRDAGFLLKSISDFVEQMNSLNLSDIEVALFCSILLIAADHPGLRNTGQVMRMQNKLIGILQRLVSSNHTENPNLFNDLMKMIPAIRILNCLHSKRLMTCEMEHGRNNLPETVGQLIEMIYNGIVNRNKKSSIHLDQPSQSKVPVEQPLIISPEEANNSPGKQTSSSTISYELSTTDSIGDEKLSSISMCGGDSNSSLQTSSSSSSGILVHDDSEPSETMQTINLVHEVRSA